MALDIGIQNTSGGNDPLVRDLVVSLEEGDFSFLLDSFEKINELTGAGISPYDDARLQGKQLVSLLELIEEKISDVKAKPKTWDEYIGFQLKPKKKLYTSMVKSELLNKLENLKILINRAIENNGALFFFVD